MDGSVGSRKEIAVAVVEHAGRYLVGRRPANVPLAGYWEFPGGKVLPGESPAAAAVRECLEETGLEVRVESAFPDVMHQYAHDLVALHFFRCLAMNPAAPLKSPFQWASCAELETLQFPEANRELIATLIANEKFDGPASHF